MKRILFLSSWFPYPPNNGSKIRIYNLLRALARKHDVTLITFADAQDRPDVEALSDICGVAAVVPTPVYHPTRARAILGFLSAKPRHIVDTYSPAMAATAQRELDSGRYDVVVASEGGTARYAATTTTVPKVFDDVEMAIIREQYARAGSSLARVRYWLTWQKTRRYIGWLVQRFDACTVVSRQEQANVREIAPAYSAVHIIENGVDVEALQPGLAEPQPDSLVYNGALTYGANYDAMRYFLADIWPLLKAARPTATLRITGRTDGVNLGALALGDGATLTGYLPDIRPTVAGAWACVVPLRVGGGTRLKILEAMALGTPVIATSKGAEGLDVTPDVNILIADDAGSFADQTLRVLNDPRLRHRLAENGRRLVEECYSWRSIGERFASMVERVALERALAHDSK